MGCSAVGQQAVLQWDRALLQWDRGRFCSGTSGMGAVLQWDARVYVGLRTGTFSLGSPIGTGVRSGSPHG